MQPPARPSTPPLFPCATPFRSYLPAIPDRAPASLGLARASPSTLGEITDVREVAVPPFVLHAVAHEPGRADRKSTRLNSSHPVISYPVFCLKTKTTKTTQTPAG